MLDLHQLEQVLTIPRYKNLRCQYLGMDHPDQCLNKKWFAACGLSIQYHFNEVGYRDRSIENINNGGILVLGDSFTLGLGCPENQCWPRLLENLVQKKVQNFSLNGASNDWISRKLEQILRLLDPSMILIHYTFSHRRESTRSDWFDDERTLCDPDHSCQENLENFQKNFQRVQYICGSIPLIQGFIPDWHNDDFDYDQNLIRPVTKIDLARDGFHYGPRTHALVAEQYARRIC